MMIWHDLEISFLIKVAMCGYTSSFGGGLYTSQFRWLIVPDRGVLFGSLSDREGMMGPQYGSWHMTTLAMVVSRRAATFALLRFILTERMVSCSGISQRGVVWGITTRSWDEFKVVWEYFAFVVGAYLLCRQFDLPVMLFF